MVFSQELPSDIYILSTSDNLKTGKTKIRYVFRYNITPKTHTETYLNSETQQEETIEINGYEYEEYMQEKELDLIFKSSIPNILKSEYQNVAPVLENLSSYSNIEIPKEINL